MTEIAKKETVSTPLAESRWIRLPAAGLTCTYSGLKRGQMLKLANNSANGIRVCHLREKGAKRGTRLIDLASLLEYIEQRAEASMKGLEA